LLGVVELALHVYFARQPPAFGDWDQLRAPIAADKRPGELIVIAPPWANPLARRALGDALMPLGDEARPDESRYPSALEVSILGQRSAALLGWREESSRQIGKFRIRRLINPAPAQVRFDFVEQARPPIADVRGTDPPMECPWNVNARVLAGGLGGHPTFPRERFECPAGMFFSVGVTVIADEEFRPRRCLWAHPLQRGELVTRFRDVPLGAVIRGHGGMYWMVEREKKGAPVTLTVRVDGDSIGEFTHHDGDGFRAFELPLGAHAGKEHAEVEFAVTTSNYQDRHFCFEADTR
jgi:hypothetical protein